jgi:hypothetical protein
MRIRMWKRSIFAKEWYSPSICAERSKTKMKNKFRESRSQGLGSKPGIATD